jgi:hypothetical protein
MRCPASSKIDEDALEPVGKPAGYIFLLLIREVMRMVEGIAYVIGYIIGLLIGFIILACGIIVAIKILRFVVECIDDLLDRGDSK